MIDELLLLKEERVREVGRGKEGRKKEGREVGQKMASLFVAIMESHDHL